MNTVTKSRKPRKPRQRAARLLLPLNGDGRNGALQLTVDGAATCYHVDRIESDYGEGFALQKFGADTADEAAVYHVNLDAGRRTCDCKGHTRWGHCKHADGLAALVQAGKL